MAVQLEKGQRISLQKEQGVPLTQIIVGLGWDKNNAVAINQKIDLDASCALFNEQNQLVDVVYFKNLKSKNGSVVHKGDNRTGEGEGDDEQIFVNLNTVPLTVTSLVFTVSSYNGQSFENINNAFCRVVDMPTNVELVRYSLNVQGSHTAQIMAKLYRHQDTWKINAIGANATGRTIDQLLSVITTFL